VLIYAALLLIYDDVAQRFWRVSVDIWAWSARVLLSCLFWGWTRFEPDQSSCCCWTGCKFADAPS